jgi:hypothetical protein
MSAMTAALRVAAPALDLFPTTTPLPGVPWHCFTAGEATVNVNTASLGACRRAAPVLVFRYRHG